MTAGDIAGTLGLAPATVSHVLGGRGNQLRIKTETQERIWVTAREMGYRTNASARAMRTGRSGNVALIQPQMHSYLPFTLLTGLSAALERRNMHLSLAYARDEALGDAGYLPKVVREWAADGLLINYIASFSAPFLEVLRGEQIPSIWLNKKREADCVYPDDFVGGQMAARHLLELGHRQIAYVSAKITDNPDPHYSEIDRYQGYATEMQTAGLNPRRLDVPHPVVTYSAKTPDEEPARAAMNLMRLADRPTAFLCYEFEISTPLLLAAAQCGLRVPEDISVMTFHGWEDATVGRAVTAIINRWDNVAEAAIIALEEKLALPDRLTAPRAIAPALAPGSTVGKG